MTQDVGIEMPGWLDRLGRLMDRTAGFWQLLGNVETKAFADELAAIAIDRPIYVAGLARAGTTILLELLAAAEGVATHRYRDFPPLYTPLFWNRAFAQVYRSDAPPAERAHKDRILVTPDSPEALEEVLWMRFFPDIHTTGHAQVLDAATSHPAFEKFYGEHIRKILMVRRGSRYLSKGNYNLTRLAYLRKLFPDARLVVPVRDPLWHIASLKKQHELFTAEERRDPRILKHMQRVGHFEFGVDRRAVDLGDSSARAIERCWYTGEEVRGWAKLWAALYGFVQRQLAADPKLAEATLIVRYEDLCDQAEATLERVFTHVGLPLTDSARAEAAARLSRPAYYQPAFSAAELTAIRGETASVAGPLGYPTAA